MSVILYCHYHATPEEQMTNLHVTVHLLLTALNSNEFCVEPARQPTVIVAPASCSNGPRTIAEQLATSVYMCIYSH